MFWKARWRATKRVLIIDQSADNREVLSIGLARRGVATLATSGRAEAQLILKQLQPDLVVLDADTISWRDFQSDAALQAGAGTRWLLLGTSAPPGKPCQSVSKPYHYRPLIRKIVQMLDEFDMHKD
jgi:hypothetical protein